MPTTFLYSIAIPSDLIGLDDPTHKVYKVYYAYHPDDDSPAAPSFSFMLVL